MVTKANFADRLLRKRKRYKHPFILGIDPVPDRIPERTAGVIPDLVGKNPIHRKVHLFGQELLRTLSPLAYAIKIQSAYYEALGWRGSYILDELIEEAHRRDILVILDGKRSDIPETMRAYGMAYLKTNPYGGQSQPDAITTTPFFGRDSLEALIEGAAADRGVFVVLRSTNPGGEKVQRFPDNDKSLYRQIARSLCPLINRLKGKSGYSSIGVVAPANRPKELDEIRNMLPACLVLAPGLGAQGGSVKKLKAALSADLSPVFFPVSRSVIYGDDGLGKPSSVGHLAREARMRFEKYISEYEKHFRR